MGNTLCPSNIINDDDIIIYNITMDTEGYLGVIKSNRHTIDFIIENTIVSDFKQSANATNINKKHIAKRIVLSKERHISLKNFDLLNGVCDAVLYLINEGTKEDSTGLRYYFKLYVIAFNTVTVDDILERLSHETEYIEYCMRDQQ